jgi:hypothetical protein
MDILNVLRQLDRIDYNTLIACLHHCAVHSKTDRNDFIKEYGIEVDENITEIMMKLKRK